MPRAIVALGIALLLDPAAVKEIEQFRHRRRTP
jgi:hypothetical protein